MTNEQILEELIKLKSHSYAPTSGDINDVNAEIEEIDNSIAEYNEQIAALEAKISDPNNYQYNDENEERDFTIELLQESFENQLDVINREDEEYKNLEGLANEILKDYEEEIKKLSISIMQLEMRLRKNDVAVRKNIGIKLTEEEIDDIKNSIANKKARIETCEKMKTEYVSDLGNYSELLAINESKRSIVDSKQASLNKIVENKKNNPKTIDNSQLRLDKDELYRLKGVVTALESRKEFISYNPNQEIDKLIAAISGKNILEQETKNIEPETTNIENSEIQEPVVEENNVNLPAVSEELQLPTVLSDEDIENVFVTPSILDDKREAEIKDAKEELKNKKKDKKFVAYWKKFSKKAKKLAAAAAVAGLTTMLMFGLKGCEDKTKNNNNNNNSVSYTKEIEENDFVPDMNVEQEVIDNTVTPSLEKTSTVTKTENKKENKQEQVVTPSTPETPSVPSTPEVPTTPETPVTPEVPETPETPEEKVTIELHPGSQMASFEDILNGNISEDTVISHGDEVGKKTDSAEIKDYTEEGNAQVEVEKKDDTNISSSKTPEEIKKALEEFLNAEITIDNDSNQWLDEMSSGKTR